MEWVKSILEANIIALLILIHASLLFCTPDTCSCDLSFYVSVLPPTILKLIHRALLFLPLNLPTIQLIAHFLVLGDVVLIALFLLRWLKAILSRLIWIILVALSIVICLYVISIITQPNFIEESKKKFYQAFDNSGKLFAENEM